MREIKFRVWDKNKKQMFYPDDFGNKIKLPGEDVNKKYSIYMQYTGLKDKNDKEIYEGDIIEFNNKLKLIVYWDNGGFALKNLTNTAEIPLVDIIRPIKVLGNIYENPELLEG